MVNDKNRLPIMGLLRALDVTLVMLAFGLTTICLVHVHNRVSIVRFLEMRTKISNVAICGLALLLSQFILVLCGIYRSHRLSSRWTELREIMKGAALLAACFAGIGGVFSIKMITLPFVGLFWIISAVVLCGSRLILRFAVKRVRTHGRNLRFLLILGTNSRAVTFARMIAARPELGYRILGFVDDHWSGLGEFMDCGLPLVTNYRGLPEFLRRNVVDEVAIFLPLGSLYRYSMEVATLCEKQGIITRVDSDIFGLNTSDFYGEEVDGIHYIKTRTAMAEGWALMLKRTVDVVVACLSIIALFPLLITVAVSISVFSPGPVFFLQERIGLNKRRFKIYKFRTMVRDAEALMPGLETENEMSGPVFKIKNDPRITTLGRLLRRSSIDELPQLVNVLKGDMSLVGPRPLPVRDFEGFNEDWQRRRFSVKPGITCLWQVDGRNTVNFDQWMLLDMQYLDQWSLWLDMKILAKTIPAVLKGFGAA